MMARHTTHFSVDQPYLFSKRARGSIRQWIAVRVVVVKHADRVIDGTVTVILYGCPGRLYGDCNGHVAAVAFDARPGYGIEIEIHGRGPKQGAVHAIGSGLGTKYKHLYAF